MTDAVAAFCTAFTLLGAKLLYWNNQPVTFGSVFLTVLISASTAHLLSAGDASVLATNLFHRATNLTCTYQNYADPLRFACSFMQRESSDPASPSGPADRFSEL